MPNLHLLPQRSRSRWPAAFTLLLLLCAADSHAIGLGLDLGQSQENWRDADASDRRETMHFAAILDSAVARPAVFNYRLTAGKEINTASNDSYALYYSGLAMTHTFGFALAQGERYRVWLGPQLKLALYDTFAEDSDLGTANSYDGFLRGYGGGLIVGYNLNLHKPVSLSFTGGTRYMHYQGHFDDDGRTSTPDIKIDADAVGYFLGFSVLFRMLDSY